jgi:hypothetical protein
MLRVTKRKNYLLVSPSRNQVAGQAPMECIPLVMEPHSSFYPDPVVVLDFQVCCSLHHVCFHALYALTSVVCRSLSTRHLLSGTICAIQACWVA